MANGVAGQQGGDRVAGPDRAQRSKQHGDQSRVLEAGPLGEPGGLCPGRVAGPGHAIDQEHLFPYHPVGALPQIVAHWPLGVRTRQPQRLGVEEFDMKVGLARH